MTAAAESRAPSRPARTELADVFKALADPNRLRILELVCAHPDEGRTASETANSISEIAAAFDLTLSTVSHHLKELRRAGLIRCEKVGQRVYCSPDQETLGLLGGFLGEMATTSKRARQT